MNVSLATSEFLLNLARQSLEHFLETKNFIPYEKLKVPGDVTEEVNRVSGGFVLLEMLPNEHRKAYVRGENGVFDRVEPLGKLITQIAVNAAFFDPHTPRLKSYELNELIIHILIPEEKIRIVGTYAEIVAQIDTMNEGIVIESRGRIAYELPPVIQGSEPESAEHRLRRLRLRLGIRKKNAETDVEYFSFSGQQLKEDLGGL